MILSSYSKTRIRYYLQRDGATGCRNHGVFVVEALAGTWLPIARYDAAQAAGSGRLLPVQR
jgi:hypothetical protein